MVTTHGIAAGWLEWAVCSAPLEDESGDAFVILPTGDGTVRIAVIDGLGHGPAAAEAARLAAWALEQAPAGRVIDAMRAGQLALARSRGAAISIVHAHPRGLSWVGVGDVQASVVASGRPFGAHLVGSDGLVGTGNPALRASSSGFAVGDLLVIWTDGVRAERWEHAASSAPLSVLAARCMTRYRTGADDALLLLARWSNLPRPGDA